MLKSSVSPRIFKKRIMSLRLYKLIYLFIARNFKTFDKYKYLPILPRNSPTSQSTKTT